MNISIEKKNDSEEKLILLVSRQDYSCLHEDQARIILQGGIDWKKVKNLACRHHVAPFLFRNLTKLYREGYFPEEEHSFFQDIYVESLRRCLSQEDEALRIFMKAQESNIRVIFLKGIALIRSLYTDQALRFMVDIDIFVEKADLESFFFILRQLGYAQSSFSQEEISSSFNYEASFSKKGRLGEMIYADVHWKLMPSRPYALSLPLVSKRLGQFEIGEEKLYCLSSEDAFLYMALHIRKHLRDVCLNSTVDIAEWVKARGPDCDWVYIKTEASRNHFLCCVYFSLYLAQELLEASCGEKIFRKFRPNFFKRFLLKSLINRNNYFSVTKTRATLIRFLLFDSLFDLFVYLVKVSFWERFFFPRFIKKRETNQARQSGEFINNK